VAEPSLVEYDIPTAPLLPLILVTLTLLLPSFSPTLSLAFSNRNDPGGTPSSSIIVTVVLEGLPNVAPPMGLESVTVKVSFPSYAESSVIGMLIVYVLVSPSDQFKVPDFEV